MGVMEFVKDLRWKWELELEGVGVGIVVIYVVCVLFKGVGLRGYMEVEIGYVLYILC